MFHRFPLGDICWELPKNVSQCQATSQCVWLPNTQATFVWQQTLWPLHQYSDDSIKANIFATCHRMSHVWLTFEQVEVPFYVSPHFLANFLAIGSTFLCEPTFPGTVSQRPFLFHSTICHLGMYCIVQSMFYNDKLSAASLCDWLRNAQAKFGCKHYGTQTNAFQIWRAFSALFLRRVNLIATINTTI